MTRTTALRFTLAVITGLVLAGCSKSSPTAQPQVSDQPAPIEFPVPKAVEQRAEQRAAAAHAAAAHSTSTQSVGGELGNMYKRAEKTSKASTH